MQLALMYGVPIGWIVLFAEPGSLRLSITFRNPTHDNSTSTGTDSSSNVADTTSSTSVAAILAKASTITAVALGTTLGVNVTVEAQPTKANRSIIVNQQAALM